jgi:peptidoglycan/LPS O-acetylase OafA/YrhL
MCMNGRPSQGQRLAGFAGLALILIMFLFAWYGLEHSNANGADAFDAYSDWVGIILVFAAFAGMSLAVFGSRAARIQLPVSLSVAATVLGALSAILIFIYIISPPSPGGLDLNRKLGVWLGLIAAGALAAGGYMTMQEEGTSFEEAADRLSSRGRRPGGGPGPEPPSSPPPPPPPPSTGP